MFRILRIMVFIVAVVAQNSYAQTPDPTKPLHYTAAANGAAGNVQDSLKLTSILISSDRKVAIINGQVLQESQTIKGIGAQVKKIDADAVTLQQNGKIWRLPLNSTIVRK